MSVEGSAGRGAPEDATGGPGSSPGSDPAPSPSAERSDASTRLRRTHPVVWGVVVPVGALAAWEVMGLVVTMLWTDAGDGVLSIVTDLLIVPVLAWLYLRTRGATTPSKTSWTWLMAILLCVLVIAEYYVEQSLYAGMESMLPADAESNYQQQMFDEDEVSFSILAVAVAPPVEELLYRGVLYGRMRTINVWLANAVQIVLFTAAHPVLTFVPVIAMFAFLQALVFEITGRLWVCVAVHALANSGVLLLLYSAVGLGVETVPLSVSIPLYLLMWALLIGLYCHVRGLRRPAEEQRKREFNEQTRQQRWQRIRAKLSVARVRMTADGKAFVPAPVIHRYPLRPQYPAYAARPAFVAAPPFPARPGYGANPAYPAYGANPGTGANPRPGANPAYPRYGQPHGNQPYAGQTYAPPSPDRSYARFMPPAQAVPRASTGADVPPAADANDDNAHHAHADECRDGQGPVDSEH